MPRIGDTGRDLLSMGLGLGTGILAGMVTGLHYFFILKNSGDSTGIGMGVGIGTGLTVGCLTWVYLSKTEN